MNEQYKTLAQQCKGKGYSQIIKIISDAGLRGIVRVYVGQCKGTIDGMPFVKGTYDTMNHGTLQTYVQSTIPVGDMYDYTTVILNESVMGDAHMPSTYWFVAVRDAASEVH